MKKLLALGLMGLCLFGCEKRFESPLKTEKASVVQLAYLPSSRGSDLATGITMNGDLAFTSVSVTIPEVWAVVFKCEDHGMIFSLRGKEIYDRARIGDEVTLEYVDEIVENSKGEQRVVDHHTKRVLFPR